MEYFIVANSFAAPIVSDKSYHYISAGSVVEALNKYVEKAKPYSAYAYFSADEYHKNVEPLARYECNLEIALQEAVKGKHAFSIMRLSENRFDIDGVEYFVKDPREGQIK